MSHSNNHSGKTIPEMQKKSKTPWELDPAAPLNGWHTYFVCLSVPQLLRLLLVEKPKSWQNTETGIANKHIIFQTIAGERAIVSSPPAQTPTARWDPNLRTQRRVGIPNVSHSCCCKFNTYRCFCFTQSTFLTFFTLSSTMRESGT